MYQLITQHKPNEAEPRQVGGVRAVCHLAPEPCALRALLPFHLCKCRRLLLYRKVFDSGCFL